MLRTIAATLLIATSAAYAEQPNERQLASCMIDSSSYEGAYAKDHLQLLDAQKQLADDQAKIADLQKQLAAKKGQSASSPPGVPAPAASSSTPQ